jgi:DNA replication licensing factor MCM7
MEVSKASINDDEDKEIEPDKSAVSQIFRLIKTMAAAKGGKRRRPRRLGRGPGRERDMDVDSDEDEDDGVLSLVDIRARLLTLGYNEAQLVDTIRTVSVLHTFLQLVLTSTSVRGAGHFGSRGQWYQNPNYK